MTPKHFTLSVLCTAILAGCGADDQAYESVPRKAEQIKKTDLNTEQVYLYMPSMAKAPRYAVSMAPFMQGQEKLVRLIYTQDGLEVRQISPDVISQAQISDHDLGRWTDVETDNSPLVKIPGTYQEYRCEEDSYGDCVNKEEENKDDDVTWQEKTFFTPEYKKLAVVERDIDDLLTYSTGCYTPVGDARLARDWQGYEVAADGSLNIEIEQDYQITNQWNCLINALFQSDDGLDFNNLTFTVSNHYSFVPLNEIRSAEYEPILYPKGDEDTFGMFATEVSRPDQLGNNTLDGNRVQYMHRFNPSQAQIDYHLSDSFDLNASTAFYKQITKDVIARINPQLAKAGVPQIKLHDPSGKRSGDLRYNVINLIDEPLANGLAGYGPSAVNPVTGEIVHAHVNQYSGGLESIANVLWDRIANQYNNGNIVTAQTTTTSSAKSDTSINTARDTTAQLQRQTHNSGLYHPTADTLPKVLSQPEQESFETVLRDYVALQQVPEQDMSALDIIQLRELEQQVWSEHNMYPIASLWSSATKKYLPRMVVAGQSIDFDSPQSYVWADEAHSQLKTWDALDLSQQHHVGQVLAGIYYAKTLVHELGHNLGLRHNFKGSNDDQNYFSEAHAHNHGLEYVPAYSSIMDYNPSLLDALPVFGLYDTAALRFAYKRQVEYSLHDSAEGAEAKTSPQFYTLNHYDEELKNTFFAAGSYLPERLSDGVLSAAVVDGVLDDKWSDKAPGDKVMREYKYCTDGNVSLNTDCNRHDEGRNHAEINRFYWQRYYEQHDMRTNRMGKKNFDESSLEDYAQRRINDFMSWREVLQNFDRMKQYLPFNTNNWLLLHKVDPACNAKPLWPESDFNYDFYCGLPRAVDELRNNLIQVVLQPDQVCEVKDADGDVQYQRLHDIINESALRSALKQGEVPHSCFHPEVSKYLASTGLTVTAEAGKMLNSGKAPNTNPKYNYVGMFDYYGFWPDKFASMATLLERDGIRRTTDRTDTALADLPYVVPGDGGTFYSYDVFKYLLQDIALGTNIMNQVFYPDLFRDSEGKVTKPQGDFIHFDPDTKVEAAPYYARSIKRYFDLPAKGEYSEIEALLNLVVQFRSSDNGEFTRGNERAQYVAIRSNDDHLAETVRYQRQDGRYYYATPNNALAFEMIKTLEEFQALRDPATDNNTLQLEYIDLADFEDPAQQPAMLKKMQRYQDVLEILPIYNR
ncbi:zinc-dependent metalloprotease [Photobacterium sp. TY1-4]|uniref:zinc-dependent metalloprotease n=1 Tax=Photobacterium sp. TY1-4 TaxID=2899122 RepID=UPI0021BE902B|nr:zinc-dependent metalloprotease [Photobacterium sp. TY1-4]UXI01868.1 zinc-dependent metalloprotease [Photobacterium sp. TY1-4]